MRPKGSKNVKKENQQGGSTNQTMIENDPIEVIMPIMETIPEVETVTEKATVADVKPEVRREYWETTKWKGVMDVLKCRNCGHCESDVDKKDKMILHVITHVAKSEQNKLFDKLVKEY